MGWGTQDHLSAWVPAGGLFPLMIRCLCWEGCCCICPALAELRPGAMEGCGAPPTPPSALLLASQDELSHINARLNMGILGCEYGLTAAPAAIPEAPSSSPITSSPISLQPTTHSRSSSAKELLWVTRALFGVSASTQWGTCSSAAPLTRPSRWVGSCLGAWQPGGAGVGIAHQPLPAPGLLMDGAFSPPPMLTSFLPWCPLPLG